VFTSLEGRRGEHTGVVPRSVQPSDRAMWHAVAATLTAVVPSVDDVHARRTLERLAAMAAYARDRRVDAAPELAGRVVALVGTDDPSAVLADPADDRRAALRRLLVHDLDQRLHEEQPLLAAFRDGEFDHEVVLDGPPPPAR
jgi:hypothetical protein